MDWMKIGSAILLVIMIAVLFPRAKQIMQDTRKAEPGEWTSALLPILAVIGFVVLLILIV